MSIESLIIYPDVHIPSHDVRALALVNKAARLLRPDYSIIMGDFADMAAVSGHRESIQTRAGFKQEITAIKREAKEVRRNGAKRHIFLMGNHCYRFDRFMMDRAAELDDAVTVDTLLGLTDMGFEVFPYREPFMVGNMRFVHDLGYSGKGAAGKSMEALGHNVVIGHIHRIEMQVGGTLDGERHVGACFGWLGDVGKISYMSKDKARKDWSLGFGLGWHDTDTGFVTLVPVPILPNKDKSYYCIVNGKKVSL